MICVAKFEILDWDGPETQAKCLVCGEEFWADATTEENLEFINECLVYKCPNCGVVDEPVV